MNSAITTSRRCSGFAPACAFGLGGVVGAPIGVPADAHAGAAP